VRAGQLDRRIVIESATEAANALGEPVKTWATFATVWANLRQPSRGREYISAQAVNVEIDQVFRVRWLDGVTEKMRVNDGGKYYDILHLAELGRRQGLDIAARLRR
jgi:SPP1 family predicted phage head-tail adaptor